MPRIPATLAFIVMCALVAGCGPTAGKTGGNGNFTTPVAGSSPATASPSSSETPLVSPPATPSPSASIDRPPTVSGAYGVLADLLAGSNYAVAIVGVDGKVAANTQATTPTTPSCPRVGAAAVPYPVSTSNNAAYFMDAAGAVRWLSPSGSTSKSPVITLPIGPTTRSVFAVSPDDSRMAVAVIDFSPNGAATRLFVDDLGVGGAHNLIFSETGQYTLWPIGWHAGYLVVAKVAACTNGIGPIWSGQVELHVVDPTTAVRKYTLGGSGCTILGPVSEGGLVCQVGTQGHEVDWTGKTFASFDSGGTESFLSPDGKTLAIITDNATNLHYTLINGMQACVFIDDSHLLSGGDAQSQPKVAVPNGSITPVSATGDCAGRVPGSL